jgi:hypothetical protein
MSFLEQTKAGKVERSHLKGEGEEEEVAKRECMKPEQ